MADDLENTLGFGPSQPASPVPQNLDARARRVQNLSQRYRNGYRVAHLLTRLGDILKIIGYVLGALAAVVGLIALIASATDSESGRGAGILLIALLYGALIVFGLYLYGTIVAGIGQIVLAVLDGAVYHAPYLNDDERAGILLLDE